MFSLHNHSEYSTKDAISKVEDIAKKTAEYGYKSFAITDHGTMGAFPEAFQIAKQYGLKFIPGIEAYLKPAPDVDSKQKVLEVAEANKVINRKTATKEEKEAAKAVIDKWARTVDRRSHHITLLAYNQEGLENLFRIYSESENYYKDRISSESLFRHKEGLIVLSGCFGSELCYYVKSRQLDRARALIEQYKAAFGENYYIEIMYHDLVQFEKEKQLGFMGEVETYKTLIQLAREYEVKMVATNDSHYVNEEDQRLHNLYKSMCYYKTEDQKAGEDAFSGRGYHLMPPEELRTYLEEAGYDSDAIDEMIESIYEIEEKVSADIDIASPPPFRDMMDELREKVYQGWERLRKGTPYEEESKKRIEYELSVIGEKNFSEYFINTSKIIERAKSMGILTGPGRGSAAGAEINYCLGITKTDPLKYGLLFERFLNPGRNKMPDIDIDIQASPEGYDGLGRDVLMNSLEDVFKFNGKIMNNVTASSIVLFKKLAAYYEVPFGEANKFTTSSIGKDLLELDENPGEQAFYDALAALGITPDEKWHSVIKNIDICYKLDGIVHGSSVHASGVIMTEEPVVLPKNSDGVINFNGTSLEAYKYCKYDLLSVDTLDPIRDIYGLDVDWEDTDDPAVWETLSNGDTQFVFQLASDGMKYMLKNGKVNSIEKLAEINAIYRPGPLGMGLNEVWVDIQQGGDGGLDETLKVIASILKDAFGDNHSGLAIFQEDVMRICVDAAGFDLTEADDIREAMGKKKKEKMELYKPKFIAQWDREKYPIDPEKVWEKLEKFAEYAFPKAHAVAYSLISYQTAKLLTHNREEYYEWLMNKGTPERRKEVLEACKKEGYELVFPSLNEQKLTDGYKIEGKKIYVPVKESNESQNLSDFVFSAEPKVSKINLILKGVLDSVCVDRRGLAALVKAIPESYNHYPTFPPTESFEDFLHYGKVAGLWDYEDKEKYYEVLVNKPRSKAKVNVVKDLYVTDDVIEFNINQDIKHFKVAKKGVLSRYPTIGEDVVVNRVLNVRDAYIRTNSPDLEDPSVFKQVRALLDKEMNSVLADPRFKRHIEHIEQSYFLVFFKSAVTSKDKTYTKVTLDFDDERKIFYVRDKELANKFLAADKNTVMRVGLKLEKYINKKLEPVLFYKLTDVFRRKDSKDFIEEE